MFVVLGQSTEGPIDAEDTLRWIRYNQTFFLNCDQSLNITYV
jgi:hypothetical protein